MAAQKMYILDVTDAIRSHRTSALLARLDLNDIQAQTVVFERKGSFNMLQLQTLAEDKLRNVPSADKWAKVIAYHLSCLRGSREGRKEDSFEDYLKAAVAFRDVFEKEEGNWLDRVIVIMSKQLRIVADGAHKIKLRTTGNSDIMNHAGEEIRRALKSASQCQKGPAVLPLIVVLYKLYFKIGNMRLSKELSVMVRDRYPVTGYPYSEQVPFLFFNGILKVMDEGWQEAQTNLTEAFNLCHPSSPKNKRVILSYLVPVRMLLGVLPHDSMLQRYNLEHFRPIARAVRQGNPVALRDALETNQYRFIQAGTYLLMEKLHLTAYRTLIKRVHTLHRMLEPENEKLQNQVHLVHVQNALRSLGEDVHIDEMECIVANLISKKYMKGYISHTMHRLVLSAKEPYPPLCAVQLT